MKDNIKIKAFYYFVFLLNIISLFFTIVKINNQSYLLVFLFVPIVCILILFQYYKKTASRIFKTVLIFFSTCLLPIEALLLLTNQSVENWFIKIDKTVFFFVYYKKIHFVLFLISLIISELVADKYLKNKALNVLLAFFFAVFVLFVYNAI